MPEVKQERNGWRDEAISRRHRQWGFDCPMVDIDFLCAEYNHSKTVALVEYKNENAELQHPAHPSYRALRDLCDRAKLPFFAARYATDLSWYKVTPLNGLAKSFIPIQKTMSEVEWVTFLYKLRGCKLPPNLFQEIEIEF